MRTPIFFTLVFFLLAAFAGPAAADIFPIKTPSGNIECTVGVGGVSDIMCTIHARNDPPAQRRPASCNGPWGHHFSMTERGAVEMRCGAPGPKNTSPGVDVAPYGETGDFGGITCKSERTGFECRNLDGHGFFLSRRTQKVF